MRWWHWLRAHLGGYFWLPCPLCGKMFGGHEGGKGTLMTTPFEGQMVCKKCSDRAEKISHERMEQWKTEPKWWERYNQTT